MQLSILAFGIARDILGAQQYELEAEGELTVAGLKTLLSERFPEFTRLASLAIAVNAEYAQDDLLLSDRDEIALIPPVSGG